MTSTTSTTPRTLGLRARVSLAVLVLVLALTVLVTIVVKRSDNALHDVERARFEANTAQLADAISYGVLAHSDALVAPALDAFAHNPDLAKVEVLADGRALTSRNGARAKASGGDSDGDASDDSDVVAVSVPVRTKASAPGDDGELAAFGVAASSQPRVVGEVRATFNSSATAAIQQRTRNEIVLAAIALGLFGLVAAGALMTSVVRRVRTVADAAARVRSGSRDVSVAVEGGDELTQLAADFNAMTRALDDAANALAERESLAAIGRATAVIAHELKNPLGIVLGAAQIVGNEAKPLEARRQAASIVEEEVRRLSRTLEGLLSYARPRAPEQKRVDVVKACEEAATRATLAGGPMHSRDVIVKAVVNGKAAVNSSTVVEGTAADVATTLVAASALPRSRHDAHADEGHVQQILLNLVQNAAQAGARRVELVVRDNGAGAVEVRVVDDGPGVSSEMREKLFVPFATTKQRGTGLGLAGSRRIARDNGGDLAFVAREHGAEFVLTLPKMEDAK